MPVMREMKQKKKFDVRNTMHIKQRGEGGNVIHLIQLLATDHFLITCLYLGAWHRVCL